MALPRLPNTGACDTSDDDLRSKMDYFNRVSDLIQSDECRRQHRRPHRNDSRITSGPLPSDSDNSDYGRQSTLPNVSRSLELPSVASSSKHAGGYGDMPPSMLTRNGFYRGGDSPSPPAMKRPTQSSYGREMTMRPTKSSYGRGIDLPAIPTPSCKGVDLPALPTPSHKSITGSTLRAGPSSSPKQKQPGASWRPNLGGFPPDPHDVMGQSFSQMHRGAATSSHHSLDDFGKQRSLPGLARHTSLPTLQQQALGSSIATQRQSWNQAGSSDSTATTPDIPQPAESHSAKPWAPPWQPTGSPVQQVREEPSAKASPWAPPWQPTAASESPQPVDMVPTLPVPIRGLHSMPQPATRSGSWQPGFATDTVLAPLGELPTVPEVSARSMISAISENYPSSLVSADPSERVCSTRDTSPLRSPVPGIGPPTPEAPPAIDANTALVLGNALLNQYANNYASNYPSNYPSSPALADPVQFASPEVQSTPPPPLNLADPSARPVVQSAPPPPLNLSQPQDLRSRSPIARGNANCRETDFPTHPSSSSQQPCARSTDPALAMHAPPTFHPDDLVLHGSPPVHHSAPSQQHLQESVEWQHRAAVLQNAIYRSHPCPMSACPMSVPPPPLREAIGGGNELPPRSPLRRKEVAQQSRSMSALPVLGAMPSLSVGRRC